MGVQPIAVPQGLAQVLNSAGDKSNVDFNYLLQTAMRESSLNPAAKAPTSSAVGLFQFLESTWLQVVKEQGPRLGYQQYADAITRDSDGDYAIKDKDVRAKILKLREDPQMAADMAAAFTQSNGAFLEAKFGRMPSPGELYIAHFLGPQGAEKFFKAGLADPDQIAAKLFPKQAKANRPLFYDDGHARTIREVYKALVARHSAGTEATITAAADPRFVVQQLSGSDGAKWPTDEIASRIGPADMSFTSLYSTEAAYAAKPLIPTASDPLLAIDTAAGAPQPLGLDRPLPAPPPLVAPSDEPLALVDAAPLQLAEPALPQARVLMTSLGTGEGSTAFLTQIFGQR